MRSDGWCNVFSQTHNEACTVLYRFQEFGIYVLRVPAAVISLCVFITSFLVDAYPSRVVTVCWLLEFGVLGVQQHDYHVAMPADTERGVDVSTLCCFHQRTLTLGSHARRAVEIRDAYQSREQSAW